MVIKSDRVHMADRVNIWQASLPHIKAMPNLIELMNGILTN